MAYCSFSAPSFDRRALLRGAGVGGLALLASAPAAQLLAREHGNWPAVRALIEDYVGNRKVANMVAHLGWGQAPATTIARGVETLGEPDLAGENSLYRVYSMTKPVTGMAVMKLVAVGALGLDQPLYEILPAFRDMRVQRVYDGPLDDTVPAERAITIRHLLTHTAGLGYGIIQQGPIKTAYERAGLVPGQVSRLPIPGLDRGKPAPSLEIFADRLAEVPLVGQPGERWRYSVSLDLLGRVIEVVTEQPFDAYLQDAIFAPAGMTSTFFRVPESEVGRLTTNYAVLGGRLLPLDPASASVFLDEPNFPYGGAGLVSSPADFDRFLRMLVGLGEVDGVRVMAEDAVRLGTSNLLPDGAIATESLLNGEGFGAGGRVGTGAREGTYGWGGAAGTTAFVDMKRGLRAGMYTQFMPPGVYSAQTDFLDAVVADLVAMAATA